MKDQVDFSDDVLAEIKISCLVDGCQWVLDRPDSDNDQPGQTVTEHHLAGHTYDELHGAARNGMLFAFCDDPLQTETAVVYIKAFLEWIEHQNSIQVEERENDFVVVPVMPTPQDILALINGFIETDYRFGN